MSRFNMLSDDDLSKYDEFFITPMRNNSSQAAPDETCFVSCDAGEAEVWTVIGVSRKINHDPVHEVRDASEAMRILTQIMQETQKTAFVYDTYHGFCASCSNVLEIAEVLTFWISEDIPDGAPEDAFDNHPMAELREAAVDYSDYSGLNTAQNPYEGSEN